MEIKNGIKGLKEESKVYEREILSLLLEISKSFSSGDMTKEKRNENFKKIDEFREKIKDISKIIEDIENSKYDCVYKDENKETDDENKKEIINIEENEIKKEDKENKESDYVLENIECIYKQETIIEAKNIDNGDDVLDVKENIDVDKVDSKEISEEHNTDLTKEDLENIDRVIENIGVNNSIEENTSQIDENKEEEKLEIEKENNVPKNEEIKVNKLEQDLGEEAIEKIDRLIKEAKELNNAVIKFPEEKVIRRNRTRQYDEIEDEEANYYNKANLNFDYKQENYDNTNDTLEPVPVLFGNRRVQNQMIVRKKSNGFSDKLKSLIFKIKVMLGGENEE